MSPAEEPIGERIARLEAGAGMTSAQLNRLEQKVDKLLEAFNMGRGGAVAIAKMGGLVLVLAGGLAWLWQNVLAPLTGPKP
jgi:hypothetical protein